MGMAKSVNNDPADQFIRKWMIDSGIDLNSVAWYRLVKEHGDIATIEMKMFVQHPIEPGANSGERERPSNHHAERG